MRSGAHIIRPYILALAATLASIVLRWPLWDVLGNSSPYLTFCPAIVLAAWAGGFGPGFAATALSVLLAKFFLIPPIYSIRIEATKDWGGLILFSLVGLVLSGFADAQRRATRRATSDAERIRGAKADLRRSHHELELRVAERTEALTRSNAALEAEMDRRARAEHGREILRSMAGLLAATGSRDEGVRGVLDQLRQWIGCELAEYWEVDEASREIRLCVPSHVPDPAYEAFVQATRSAPFAAGDGLPGKVWASGEYVYLPALDQAAGFKRAAAAGALGLTAGLALPLRWRDRVQGAVLLLGSTMSPPAGEALALVRATLDQLGPFLERVRVSAALSTAGDRLSAVLDASTEVAIIATDAAGRLTVFNRGAQRMLGYGEAEMLGRTPAAFHLESEVVERGAALSAERGRDIRGFEVFVDGPRHAGHEEREWTYVRKDGSRLTVNLVVTALRDSAGAVSGFLGVAKDVTAARQAEAELKQAKGAAEAANRAKSEFLANMSHEIRTPMNGILGMTELALDTRLTPQQRGFLEAVRASADSLLRIIDDILDFSKIEAGKLDLDPVDFRLRNALAALARPLALRAKKKGLRLAIQVDAGVPEELHADLHRIQQVLVNLLGNAIKFTSEGEILIAVELDGRSGDDVLLHFAIRDSGIGVPADKLESIFKPFTQADGSTTRRYGGTGLGLTISAQLAALLGGSLRAESVPGAGSVFHFLLRAEAREHAPHHEGAQVAGLRVLVVDDHVASRAATEAMVASWQMRAVGVATCADAVMVIEDAGDDPYRLVLADAALAREAGGFALVPLRNEDLVADPALLIIALPAPATRTPADRMRVSAAIETPVQPSKLLEAIQVALGCGTAPAATSVAAPTAAGVGLRVLLAEDNPINQAVATHLLEKHGHAVTLANDGSEAVELAAERGFDVILMDVQMPRCDGLEATARIRQAEARDGAAHVPIIAMTAHAMKGDRERCLAAGMDGYVSKPVREALLLEALDACAGSSRAAAATPAAPPPTAAAVDVEQLRERLDGDDALLASLVQLFVSESARLLQELGAAIASADAGAVSRSAHQLRGMLANLAARPSSELALELDHAAAAGDFAHLAALRRRLQETLGHVHDELVAIQGGFPAR